MGLWDQLIGMLVGTPEKHKRVSTLGVGQEQILQNLIQSLQGGGAGGAFGDAADYYRDLLSDNPEDFQRYAAGENRRFNEETIPGLSEQFAGMGSGGLSSSGFRNAAVSAGTDLNERLGAIRAQLRQQGAAGLSGLGSQALGNYTQEVVSQQGTPGLAGPALGALGTAALGPIGGVLGGIAGNYLSSFGKSGIYKNNNAVPQPAQPGGR